MIVNPQLFNYRITIGTLVVAIAVLATFSFTSYNESQTQETYLKQEKALLHNDLSEVISKYENLLETNKSLEQQYNKTKEEVTEANLALKQIKSQSALVNNYRKELKFLKQQQETLVSKQQAVASNNNELTAEISALKKQLKTQEANYNTLKIEKVSLENTLNEASLLMANSFEAKAFKVRNKNKKIETHNANEADNIHLCFVLAENVLAPKGNKDFYIQVIGPDSNIVSDQGSIEFDDSLLIYSSKTTVEYNNQVLEVCADIEKEEYFKEGLYYISVFEDERRLGGTKIELN